MKIAVMGAGAVGAFYGAMLARGSHDVTLVGRPAHVEAINRQGLRLEMAGFDGHVPMHASTEASAVADAQWVLFCVKSADTEAAGRAMAPWLASDATILCLQNGVDNAERLRAVLGTIEVLPAVVYVATAMAGPGHVKHYGRGDLVIGPSAASAGIAGTLSQAGVPTQVSDNVVGALWAKLILNCAYNALSAVAQLPYGKLAEGEGVRAVMDDVVRECLAVAQALGVTVPGDVDEAVRHIVRSMPGQLSSTAQDLARGKPSEIDYLNGYVARQGEALGVPTPVNRVLHVMVKLLESKT